MAKQDTVRALVPHAQADQLRGELLEMDGAGVSAVTVSAPDPATYREETADRRVRQLARYGWKRLVLGAIVGALVGAGLALLVAWEWLIYTIPLFAFGGAWGGAITSTARGIQVAKEDVPGNLEDETVEVEEDETQDLRVLTILVEHDRGAVIDLLTGRTGVTLLDSWHPKVGHGPDARPDESPPADPPD